MTLIVVSVLNYNSSNSTINCIKSLIQAEKLADGLFKLQIQVTDNGSTEADFTVLQEYFHARENIQLLRNHHNRGFSAGHNQNIAILLGDYNPDFVWVLNNDCLVDTAALPAQLNCAANSPEVAIWGATLIEHDGETIQCAGGCFYNRWVSSYRQYGNGLPLRQLKQLKSRPFDYLAGASLFFPVATLKSGLGTVNGVPEGGITGTSQWFNEELFLYFEELDLVRRLLPGKKIGWCKDARLIHFGGMSTGTFGGNRTLISEYHSNLSALKFNRMYYPRTLFLMLPLRFIAKILVYLFSWEIKLVIPMTRAYRDFFQWVFTRRDNLN